MVMTCCDQYYYFLLILLGTFAVISILVSKPTIEHCSGVDPMNPLNGTFINQTSPTDDVIRCEMKVAVAVTFISGFIQVIQKGQNSKSSLFDISIYFKLALSAKPIHNMLSATEQILCFQALNVIDTFSEFSKKVMIIYWKKKIFIVLFYFKLIMGFLKLGILSSLLSDSLMSGFTFGSAFHVLTSQVPHLLGYRITKITGLGRLVKVSLCTNNY